MKIIGSPETAARRQHFAEILCQPFVNPQQIAAHRLFKIRCRQASRTAILPIPRMSVFMAHQLREVEQFELIAECLFANSVFARFVMLESFAAAVVAESHEKLVASIMARAKQCVSFLNECFVTCQRLGLHVERRRRVTHDVELMHNAGGAEWKGAEVCANDCRRVYELG